MRELGLQLAVLLGLAALLACSGKSGPFFKAKPESSTETSAESDPAPTSTVTVGTEDESLSSVQASEPIPIAGAFLSCSYANPMPQGATQIGLACAFEASAQVKSLVVSTTIEKIDLSGKAYPLLIDTAASTATSWKLSETTTTLFISKIRATITFANASRSIFETSVDQDLPLINFNDFWLPAEPNDYLGNEDCITVNNAAARAQHITDTGLSNAALNIFNDYRCDASFSFLCRSIDASLATKWLVSATKGPFNTYPSACPAGYAFALPMTATEVQEVFTLIDKVTNLDMIWTNLNDRDNEGVFKIILK